MRKLKLQVQISLDGYIAGPNGEMDWITWTLDDKILEYISDLNRDMDLIIMGRVLAEGFIPHWKMEATDPTKKRDFIKRMSESYDFAMKMHETKKVVFTRSPNNPEWNNTVVANGDYVEEIKKLKSLPGNDIMIYGGARFVSSVIKAGLIDEYHLFVNPAAIGEGMTIFKSLDKKLDFELVKATPFECGIVVLKYEPKKIK